MTLEKRKRFIINFAFTACIIVILYFCFKYLAAWLLPFIIGLAIAAFLQRPINWITQKTRLNKSIVAPILAFILLTIIGFLCVLCIYNAINEVADIVVHLPEWYQKTAPAVADALSSRMDNLLERLPNELEQQIGQFSQDIIHTTQQKLISLSGTAVTWLANKASLLPAMLISIIITIVATFFMSVEFDNLKHFFKLQIPQKYRIQVTNTWDTFGKTLLQMLRSYLLIMFITFVELSIGLVLLKVDYAILLAAIISLVDILPVIGTGTILIPWGLISLIMGQTGFGIAILVLYVVITVIRNILEPRIIGKRIGLHPLVTLIFMYLGLHVMGIVGMFVFPLAVILLKDLQSAGKIHLWQENESDT